MIEYDQHCSPRRIIELLKKEIAMRAVEMRERVWAIEQARRMVRAARAARRYGLGEFERCLMLAARFRRIAAGMAAC